MNGHLTNELELRASTYIRSHRALLNALRETSALSTDRARSIIRLRLQYVRRLYENSKCVSTLIAYERYLRHFSMKFGLEDLVEEFTLLDKDTSEEVLNKDPSRSDEAIALAILYMSEGKSEAARVLLQRVAASRCRESTAARHLLSSMVNEFISC